jgi:hypothetical protein
MVAVYWLELWETLVTLEIGSMVSIGFIHLHLQQTQ